MCFVFIWSPRPHWCWLQLPGKEGRKDGTTSSFFIYNNCWLCSSPTATMCPWKPCPGMRAAAKVLQLLLCCRGRNWVEHFITAKKAPPQPGVSTGWAPDPFREGVPFQDPIPGSHSRVPFQVCLGRAGASQLLEKPQNVPGSCRHHCHEILMISWRAQSWLMVRNSPYEKSEAKYNWKKEDGGVAIAGRQK